MQKNNVAQVELKGYRPGAIGRITELHAVYYSQQWGLGLNFEAEIAAGLSAFLLKFDSTRDGFWTVVVNDKIVGSIAVEQSRAGDKSARLRWFIVASEYRGYGIGQLLLRQAIDFCQEAEVEQIYLWTFAGLTAARHLYDQFGFKLEEEHADNRWGNTVTHQKFKLDLR
jgi:RimJ/RimL family protein N-acetyltransferase